MQTKNSIKIGIVQDGPVHLNLPQSLEKASDLISQAAAQQADLVVFGETWLSGYPAWLDHCPHVARWDYEPAKQVFARMYESGIEVPGPVTELLAKQARQHQLYIGIGVNEIVRSGVGNGTIYNSFLLFGANGELLLHHRKLMPTYTEKMIYGLGDSRGLRTVQTPFGRIGGLICWEHWMPLTRQTLHNCGETIHLALWPNVHEMLQIASRAYAFEGRTFVVAVGQLMQASQFPPELQLPDYLQPDSPVLKGGSSIIAPNGHYLLDPQYNDKTLIVHEIEDLSMVAREKMSLDTSGHYNRPDVFDFKVKNPPTEG
ncbi:MAG: carbon-nitrogen hydrolase family protein [Bacteroidota bacterium]